MLGNGGGSDAGSAGGAVILLFEVVELPLMTSSVCEELKNHLFAVGLSGDVTPRSTLFDLESRRSLMLSCTPGLDDVVC